jgi:hypothetical protein
MRLSYGPSGLAIPCRFAYPCKFCISCGTLPFKSPRVLIYVSFSASYYIVPNLTPVPAFRSVLCKFTIPLAVSSALLPTSIEMCGWSIGYCRYIKLRDEATKKYVRLVFYQSVRFRPLVSAQCLSINLIELTVSDILTNEPGMSPGTQSQRLLT